MTYVSTEIVCECFPSMCDRDSLIYQLQVLVFLSMHVSMYYFTFNFVDNYVNNRELFIITLFFVSSNGQINNPF